jgi:glycosyltransferase involved in cell wall biosynthesis
VIPNGVPGTPIEKAARTPSKPLQLLFIGQLRVEKGTHLLSETIARLGDDVRLSIAGDGALAPEIALLAARDSRVTQHGFVRGVQKDQLFNQADVLLFPSTWTENAPLVLSEAMMHGLPVIASDIGAIPEFVRHESNGLLFPVRDASSLATSIQRLQCESGLLTRLSQGASRSAEKWTVGAMGQRYLEAYRSVRNKTPLAIREVAR